MRHTLNLHQNSYAKYNNIHAFALFLVLLSIVSPI